MKIKSAYVRYRTYSAKKFDQTVVMDMHDASRVIAVEKLSGGVIITFEDGMNALFSARLLRLALDHAWQMKNVPVSKE